MTIQFNAVSSYLKLNRQGARQELSQQFQQAYQQIQASPEQMQAVQQDPSGAKFIQTLAKVSPSELSSEDVKTIQRFLVQQGYNLATARTPNGVDGKYGPRTHRALQSFLSRQEPQAAVSEAAFRQAAQAIDRDDLSRENVITVQTFLSQKGYAIGSAKNPTGIDGIYGAKTHQALLAYQAGPNPSQALKHLDQLRVSAAAAQKAAQPNLPHLSFADPISSDLGQALVHGQQVFSRTANSINSWFVPQFSPGSLNPRADCGPAATAMILRSNGLAKNSNLGTVRRSFLQVNHNHAVTAQEVARGVEHGSSGKLDASVVTGNVSYRQDPKAFLNRIRTELAAGHQVILLSKNMATMNNGHYTVVQGVNADNSIVLADPGSKAYGKNRTFSYERFASAFFGRVKEGMPNDLVVVTRP